MTKQEFLFHLSGASFLTFKFAENFVKNKLSTNFKYNLHLNSSVDDKSQEKFDRYPEDNKKVYSNLNKNEVVELLYRKGKIPVWIDISVLNSNKNWTTLELICAGRYTNEKEELYYNKNGTGPFGIKSPTFPPNYKEGKKFKL